MVFAAVFAGGTGSRMAAGVPKQYLMLGGKPVIVHTVEKFFRENAVEKILVLCPCEFVGYTSELLGKYFPDDGRITVLSGGSDRNGTLKKAISYIKQNYGLDDDSIILTHDAVRPFVTERIIKDNIRCASEYGACNTAVGATDTVAVSSDGKFIEAVPDRSNMYIVQTPQSFRIKELSETMDSLSVDEESTLTDACGIYTMRGMPVRIVAGETFNIKITYPNDLSLAEAILKFTSEEK